MSFFQGASNVTINGGQFNNVGGNFNVFNHSSHETNFNSKNVNNNTINDSFNDNSQRHGGGITRPRQDHAGPQPPEHPRSPFTPSFTSGNLSNFNSFNVNNTQVNDAYNDYSRTYHYAPPPNQGGRDKTRKKSMHGNGANLGIEEDDDLQSNLESSRNGQTSQAPFQPKSRQYMRTGVRSGPSMMVENPNIMSMPPEMRETFAKLMEQTQSLSGQSHAPNVPGNIDENDPDSDDADSSTSPNISARDSMNAKMADLSINDPIPSLGHLRPPSIISRVRSDPLIPPQSITSQGMGFSNPLNLSPYDNALQHSHSTPSVVPHMQEPVMDKFLVQSTAANRGEIHRVEDPDQCSEHQMNDSAFDMQENSLVDSSGKGNKKKGMFTRKWLSR